MRQRLILFKLTILVLVLASMPISRAQMLIEGDRSIRISSYQDDPFVEGSSFERIDGTGLEVGDGGRPMLSNEELKIVDESVVYRQESDNTDYFPFATNPWPHPMSNEKGNFKFPQEERFPLHLIERGADGKPILNEDGLQIWKPREIHLGMTTIFDAASAAKEAAEDWSGRRIAWGTDGLLEINSHAFIAFNAFFSPTAQAVYFGVVPYRPAGQTQVQMFEMGTSWEVAAHETGHALHGALKPNRIWTDLGFRTWSESFGDQLEMWASLRDPRRTRYLLGSTNGNLNQSNAITSLGEALGGLLSDLSISLRDAFHDKKVSDTSEEVHDRSEVLTGASYKLFLLVYGQLRNDGLGEVAALEKAGDIMGTFLVGCTDYTPENGMEFVDVAKAYLKVDKERFGGRYHAFLVDEFIKRELLTADSVNDWLAHEAQVPELMLPRRASDKNAAKMVQSNLDKLGIGTEFGLTLQSVTHDSRSGNTMVRVQLTEGREADAAVFDNHGILTFRADRTLADYHSPIPGSSVLQTQSALSQNGIQTLVGQARLRGLDRRGAPLSIVRDLGGRLTVEARVLRGSAMSCHVVAYTLDYPQGERREVITPTIPRRIAGLQPGGTQILTADDLRER
jgi:hypothetical protein